MKVKFLKDGRWAHASVQRGQFDFKEGDVVSDICEQDAIDMRKASVAEVIGENDIIEFEKEIDDEVDEEPVVMTTKIWSK